MDGTDLLGPSSPSSQAEEVVQPSHQEVDRTNPMKDHHLERFGES